MVYCLILCQIGSLILTEISLYCLARFSQFILRLTNNEARHYYNKCITYKKQKNYEH